MATKYATEDRYKAAAALVATGNSKAASRESGVPASTIRHWANNDEDFQMMRQEIRTEFGEEIKYMLAEIIHESAAQTLDRVRNGDTESCKIYSSSFTLNLLKYPFQSLAEHRRCCRI